MLTITRSKDGVVYEVRGERIALLRVAGELELAGSGPFARSFRDLATGRIGAVLFSTAAPELRAGLEAAADEAGVVVVYENDG